MPWPDATICSSAQQLHGATPCVYIVTLNWNGWRHTLECLQSLLRPQGVPVVVVVCDNASSDGSMQHIEAWARGEEAAPTTAFLPSLPPREGALDHCRLSRSEAEAGATRSASLVLIDNGSNLGFAGGCNVGIRYALTRADCGYVWLLNNDCVVPEHTLAQMVALCQERPAVGICGSQVRYYDQPDLVQTFGGLLNPWLCTTHSIACGAPASSVTEEPPHIDFVPGASMLVTRAFLQRVGLMTESYFLYFEEIDWAERAKGHFELAVCLTGVVYHRGAASIGSPTEGGERGVRSEYFLLRNRLVFARNFYRSRLPVVYAGLLVSMLNRVRRKQWSRVRVVACALFGIRPSMTAMTAGATDV